MVLRLQRSASTILWVALSLFLVACVKSNNSRDCPAFDHPALSEWQTARLGETVTFTSNDGESAVYLVESIANNEPFRAIADRGTPACILSSDHVLVADDDSHGFLLEYSQADDAGVPPEDDGLSVYMLVETRSPDGVFDNRARIFLTEPEILQSVETAGFQRTYFESMTLTDGQEYTDVIEHTSLLEPLSADDPPVARLRLRRVVFARGAGLVEFERLDGVTYSRISSM